MNTSVNGFGSLGSVTVQTTHGRGASAEELADRALEKLIYLSAETPDVLKSQVMEYRERIRQLLIFYLTEAQRSERTTIANILREAGASELIPLLNR